jgi:hypothetical protein
MVVRQGAEASKRGYDARRCHSFSNMLQQPITPPELNV